MNKIIILAVLVTLLISGCKTTNKGSFDERKTCQVDSDCSLKSGCYCGCYNKDYRDEKLDSMFCTCQSATGNFADCKCINNLCQ